MTRAAAAALLAAGVAGCSGDVGRFGAEPFANPYSKVDAAPTGSLPPRASAGGEASLASPSSRVVSAPLAAPARAAGSLAAPRGAENIASANAVSGGAAGWSAQGGSRVTLGEGESVDALSGRFGVPTSAILAANGLAKASDARPGQSLVIPVYSAGSAGTPPASRPAAPKPAVAAEAPKARTRPGMVRQEAAAEPARGIRPKVLAAKPADDDDDVPTAKPAKARLAPAKPEAKAAPVEVPKPAKVARAEPKPAEAKAPEPLAAAKPAKVEIARAPAAEPAKAEAAPASTGSLPDAKAAPEFRWPARGRVIAGYGAKTGAGSNDGVNIALPEGTAVKAAEAGTVAYAGEELKGYGKLVLVRHTDGWVSAYANNGELNVKRGDVIKRGQVVAKSGATGNVSSPQLHFELRKGSSPVDPTKYLDAN